MAVLTTTKPSSTWRGEGGKVNKTWQRRKHVDTIHVSAAWITGKPTESPRMGTAGTLFLFAILPRLCHVPRALLLTLPFT
jgi:hypothetical protein